MEAEMDGIVGCPRSPDAGSSDRYPKSDPGDSNERNCSSDSEGGAHSSHRLAMSSSASSTGYLSRNATNAALHRRELFAEPSNQFPSEVGKEEEEEGGVLGTENGILAEAQPPVSASPSSPSEAVLRPAAVGLINEGCTCYLNSLLQLLFHTSYFRTAVYQIPMDGDDSPSVYKALQETFFQMQERTIPARTTVLTDAFGWGKQELYVQHDIQEMATLLRDNLEERMKGTVSEGAINQLFEGRGEQFVETLDKSFVSRRSDIYYDIHIPLGTHHTLLDSLTSLTARDQLVGDNKYRVEREGQPAVYMDAEKGYSYTRFPAVAWFHLKRFAMDLTSPTLEMRKVNAPLEFPVTLDLRSLEKPQEEEEEVTTKVQAKLGSAVVPFSRDSPAIYDLHGVIVHRGTVRSGHYYCYIREWDPVHRCFTRWLEYDDDCVREVSEDVAVRANYGRAGPVDSFRHEGSGMGGANAYILSYVRRADAAVILAPSPTDTVSQHVKDALRRAIQAEEQQLREAEEARMSATLCCITDTALAAYCSSTCSTELFTRDAHNWRRLADCVVTVRKSSTLLEVYETLAAQPALARAGVTPKMCRLWRCTETSSTLRPTIALATCAEAEARAAESTAAGAALECLGDYLTRDENNAAATICLYIATAKPLLPGLCGVTQETSLIASAVQDSTTRGYTVRLARPMEATALHLCLDNADYAAAVEYAITTETEKLPLTRVNVMSGDSVATVPLPEGYRIVSVTVRCYIPSVRSVLIRDVHLELDPNHPLLHIVSTPAEASPVPVLPNVGLDRALLFFKYFDCTTGTVQYVGNQLIDRAAKLRCCGAVYRHFFGIPEGNEQGGEAEGSGASVSVEGGSAMPIATATAVTPGADALPASITAVPLNAERHHQQPVPHPSMFRFFVERGDHTVTEVREQDDLADFKSGTVLVAQLRAVPAVHRYLSVSTYYRDMRNSIDAQMIEVRRTHQANDEAYKSVTLEQQRIAVAAAQKHADEQRSRRSGSSSVSTTLSTNAEGSLRMNKLPHTPSVNPSGAAAPVEQGGGAGANASSGTVVVSAEGMNSASGAILTSSVAAIAAAVEADPTRIAATLNPYEAVQLPLLHAASVDAQPGEHYCHLLGSWGYEAVCEAIGRLTGCDSTRIQLYQNRGSSDPLPETRPWSCTSSGTVTDLMRLEAYNPTSVLFFERLSVPRSVQQGRDVVSVTLRDRLGYALHRESFTVPLVTITRQGLARLVQAAVPSWQRAVDAWGTMEETLHATHYTLIFVDRDRSQIVSFQEVAMEKSGAEESSIDVEAMRRFEVELQVASPVQMSEQRVACCHMNYDAMERSSSNSRRAFGQPFLITIDATTTVRDALTIMLQTTHLPMDVLHNTHNYGVMMVAGDIYHFNNWDEHVSLYWKHTRNTSRGVPSLMLNHARPKEKPGSRYVAQSNPKLKISGK